MQDLPERFDFSGSEVKVLDYWNAIDSFHNQLERRSNCPRYIFYDGPPFATGLPHYGHILASTIKDIFGRYYSLCGFYVERRFGWDCHGLPIEFEIDKTLGIKTRSQVVEYGIANYNEKCREIVMRYATQWESTILRLGRWVDFKNDFKTMNRPYMESVWWIFSQLYEMGHVYRGYRVMPYSTACGTPLSNFEAALSYKDVSDPSITVEFRCRDEDVSFLAWTTTPWTLPSNLALCVNPDFVYVKLWDRVKSKHYMMAECRLSAYYKNSEDYEIRSRVDGRDLVGKKYEPLFDFAVPFHPNAHRIVSDSYVKSDSGTGIVHQSPAFGEDDFRIALREGIISVSNVFCPVDENGFLTSQVGEELRGKHVKEADPHIISMLKSKGVLFRRETIKHSYPFCWRSDTPLIYKAVSSWFVNVSEFRDKLLNTSEGTYWVPGFVKDGRFRNWLRDARDWCISRNRYWGTPLPIWVSSDGEEVVVLGSVDELEKASGRSFDDVHRHFIDDVVIPSRMGKGELRRVEEVFDCWFESGCLPFAHVHYPFEHEKDFLEKFFPADFIAEGIDQTRGWFYTLLVISTALNGRAPFKNVIAGGLVLASDGKKMSKRLKNYPDPVYVINKYGSDSLRLYLINSPVVRAEKLSFNEDGVGNIVSQVFVRWYNAVRFFLQNIERIRVESGREFKFDPDICVGIDNVTDKWILARIQSLIRTIRREMGLYKLYNVVPHLIGFVQQLTNIYVRFNRNRLKGRSGAHDELVSMSILFKVLMTLCGIMAPFTPFFVETVYQWLSFLLPEERRLQSVHYTDFPMVDESLLDPRIEMMMDRLIQVIELARLARDQAVCPVRQPLKRIMVFSTDEEFLKDVDSLKDYLLSELSFETLQVSSDMSRDINFGVRLNNTLGSRLRSDMGRVQRVLDDYTNEEVLEFQRRGYAVVLGHRIGIEEVQVLNSFDNKSGGRFHSTGNSSVIVVIDLERSADSRFVREIMNRIQRLRKSAKLVHTDEIVGFYSWSKPRTSNVDLEAIIGHNRDLIIKTTNTFFIPRSYCRDYYEIVDSCNSLLFDNVYIDISLAKLALRANRELLLQSDLVSTADEVEELDRHLSAMSRVPGDGSPSGTISLSFNGKDYTFQMNYHVFANQYEYAKNQDFRCEDPIIIE